MDLTKVAAVKLRRRTPREVLPRPLRLVFPNIEIRVRGVFVARRSKCIACWTLVLLAGLLALAARPATALERSAGFLAAMESIRGSELHNHAAFLADDAREGREPGTPGSRQSADYLADHLAELGLLGAGPDGGFVQPFDPHFRNVLAILPGSDPRLRQEYVVIAAHYDHVGFGNKQNSRGPLGEIHNGADDNASGVSGVLEVAQAFTTLATPPRRSILLALWDAEEKGLLGSAHWVARSTVPLDRLVFVCNLDMIGRLHGERLEIYGTRSAAGLRRLASTQNEAAQFLLDFSWEMKPDGDHWPFFDRGIPGLMFHTGVHDDYHRPSDDIDRLNFDGMEQVARFVFGVAHEVANADARPQFRTAARRETEAARRGLHAPPPPSSDRLGIAWQEAKEGTVAISRIAAGSPADRAGLLTGDRLVSVAGQPVRTAEEVAGSLMKAASPAVIGVARTAAGLPLEISIPLEGPPTRLGITWRTDDAEPGTVIVTSVAAGSPADRAGLIAGDRIYQVGGQDFTDDARFAELIRTQPSPLAILVERDGRLRVIEVRLDAHVSRAV
jgi:hypothetical protein